MKTAAKADANSLHGHLSFVFTEDSFQADGRRCILPEPEQKLKEAPKN